VQTLTAQIVAFPPADSYMACHGDPDLPLVRASLCGDGDAFDELVKRYDRKLLRIALNITHHLDDAEEAVQDAFFKAYRNLDKFRSDAKFSTWLFRIAVNESLMKLRKKGSGREESLDAGFDGQYESGSTEMILADWSPDPEALYGATEFRKILIASLQKLSPALRVVFVLRDIEEHSILETSEVLNVSANAVKSRLSRARRELREELSQYFERPD